MSLWDIIGDIIGVYLFVVWFLVWVDWFVLWRRVGCFPGVFWCLGCGCLFYPSDAADGMQGVGLGGRRVVE